MLGARRSLSLTTSRLSSSRRIAPCSISAPRSRTRALVVEANLFARIVRLAKSVTTNLVSQAEDPEKLLDTVVTEMQEDLIKMRQAAAQVMASQKQMEAKYKQAQATADDWLRRAELAVGKNEDELAKEALTRRKAYAEQATSLKGQVQQQQQAVDQLLANTRMLETKLTEAKSKKETLKARAASAKAGKQIQEMLGSLNTSNAVVAFEKMEEKVMAMEADTEATQMLVSSDKLENKFALLESGNVDDELAALKKSRTPVAALPEGRPIKDVIDIEHEDLRRKARE